MRRAFSLNIVEFYRERGSVTFYSAIKFKMVSSVLFNKKAPPSSIFLMLTAMVTVSSRLPHTWVHAGHLTVLQTTAGIKISLPDCFPATFTAVQQLRNEKSVSYSSVLQSFRDDMQCCCGERLYWYPKTHQWYCRHCGMWSNPIRPEELSQQLREKLFWICRHNERICSPQGASNIHSIESSRLSHEINTLLASPEPDAESIVRKILHRAELQFTCCSAGDADPATLQIKRACNELEPTDTFPLKLYAEIVSNVILYRDTHIEIKLRNGQIL